MPAGSQSPHSTRVVRVLLNIDRSARCHSQRAVEADDFAIEVAVFDHVADESGVLRRLSEQFWEWHRGGEALLRGFRQGVQHRGGENPWRDGVDADAELSELARR